MIIAVEYKQKDAAIIYKNTTVDDSLLNLAQQGDAKAQLKIGLRYALSPWNTKDDKQAAQWFAKAAEQGQIEAQYRYGYALLKGLGVVQDYKVAFFWLEKAARNGYADAQFSLGEMYQLGVFMNSDNERAYLWFNLAAAQGVKGAVSARDLLVKQLTKEQIIRLQSEAGTISRNQQSSTE
jgi:TPR repeat protein